MLRAKYIDLSFKMVIILLKTCALANQDLNKRTAMVKAMIVFIKEGKLTAFKSYSKWRWCEYVGDIMGLGSHFESMIMIAFGTCQIQPSL